MENTEDKDALDKINERLDKLNNKMDVAIAHLEQGYTSEEYDNDYENFFNELSNMSNEELEKEKFLSEGILQTQKKDENYNGISLMISIITLLMFILINTFDSITSFVEIEEENKVVPYVIYSLGIIVISLIFLFIYIAQVKRMYKYNHKKQQIRLKIKIINQLLKERKQ